MHALFLLTLLPFVHGLFFTLTPRTERCLTLSVGRDRAFYGAYIVTGKGEENVRVVVLDETGAIGYQSEARTREGTFDLVSKNGGVHRFCFKGFDSYPKVISFEFDLDEGHDEGDLIGEGQLEPLQHGVYDLSRNLQTVFRNIHFHEQRERVHRDLTERTCDRVLWSALVKMLSLSVISFSQIYMLKGYFDTNR